MSLRIDHVDAGYGSARVLWDASLVVPHGQVAVLLGANGAGKTTLLRTCAGLLRPTNGTVSVDGHDLTGAPPAAVSRRGVCLIPEGRAVYPTMTVRENLRLMADGSVESPEDRAADAFPVLGRKLGQLAGTMSGGEQQMLALARAYITSPAYVLLDEVSMGLAPIVVDQIFAFLGLLASSGVALLVVEQYVAKALALADLVYVLQNGRIGFAGEPGELDGDALAHAYLGGDALQRTAPKEGIRS